MTNRNYLHILFEVFHLLFINYKSRFGNITFVVLSFFLTGCYTANNSPIIGMLFTYVDHHVYDRSGGSQLGPGRVLKFGRSCSLSFAYANYFFYGNGLGGLENAMKKAGITKIASVDYSWFSILNNAFYRECVEVHGE